MTELTVTKLLAKTKPILPTYCRYYFDCGVCMLTDQRFANLYRSHNAIANVLSGHSADGSKAISTTVSFTNDVAARSAAAHKLRLLLCHCHRVLNEDDVTPLTIKLLWYLTRTCGKTAEAINCFPIITVIRAIQHAPHLVSGRTSISGMLKHYRQHLQRERAMIWATLSDDVPKRTLLWAEGAFTFEEANDPRHLVYDSLILGHCVGTLYNRAALECAKLSRDHPKAIHYLHYWMKIKDGESRIITLIEAGTPLVTVQFHVSTRSIVCAQGRITCEGQLLEIPFSAKQPLLTALKSLPVKRGGSRLVHNLPFGPLSGPDLVQTSNQPTPQRSLI